MRRKSVNTHINSHGGDRTTLYPRATQWEGIDAARARENESQNVSPITQANKLLSHLRSRYDSLLWDENRCKMKAKDTRNKVITLINFLVNIPDNRYEKESLSRGVRELIEDFEERGHKLNIKNA